MSEFERLLNEKREELAKSLKWMFGEDSTVAATMLVEAVRYRFGDQITDEDHPRFTKALARLPHGSTAKVRFRYVNRCGEERNPRWRVIFGDRFKNYESAEHFYTKTDAEDYAPKFLKWLSAEINAPAEADRVQLSG